MAAIENMEMEREAEGTGSPAAAAEAKPAEKPAVKKDEKEKRREQIEAEAKAKVLIPLGAAGLVLILVVHLFASISYTTLLGATVVHMAGLGLTMTRSTTIVLGAASFLVLFAGLLQRAKAKAYEAELPKPVAVYTVTAMSEPKKGKREKKAREKKEKRRK